MFWQHSQKMNSELDAQSFRQMFKTFVDMYGQAYLSLTST